MKLMLAALLLACAMAAPAQNLRAKDPLAVNKAPVDPLKLSAQTEDMVKKYNEGVRVSEGLPAQPAEAQSVPVQEQGQEQQQQTEAEQQQQSEMMQAGNQMRFRAKPTAGKKKHAEGEQGESSGGEGAESAGGESEAPVAAKQEEKQEEAGSEEPAGPSLKDLMKEDSPHHGWAQKIHATIDPAIDEAAKKEREGAAAASASGSGSSGSGSGSGSGSSR